ncbi:MAG: hypothetical protein IPK14_24585 [Blastocatellia bacterium]|nr:hypothetical protein [Blastocatellia bacterium]
MENRKKSIEELQAELTLESEALATLQLIYAEKVKQVRINTLLPPDIQARFLVEWETFYQQRMSAIFRKDYQLDIREILNSGTMPAMQIPAAVPVAPALQPSLPPAVAPASFSSTPAPVVSTPVAAPVKNRPAPVAPPAIAPNQAAMPAMPAKQRDFTPPPPPPPPSLPPMPSSSLESPISEDILGVNTGSWMNPAESIGYEQYSDNEPISSTLMDSDKIQDDSSNDYDDEESDSIDGFAATSGLKGLTEFMDFDLKRKKS